MLGRRKTARVRYPMSKLRSELDQIIEGFVTSALAAMKHAAAKSPTGGDAAKSPKGGAAAKTGNSRRRKKGAPNGIATSTKRRRAGSKKAERGKR
jgi:hypothetical protein